MYINFKSRNSDLAYSNYNHHLTSWWLMGSKPYSHVKLGSAKKQKVGIETINQVLKKQNNKNRKDKKCLIFRF